MKRISLLISALALLPSLAAAQKAPPPYQPPPAQPGQLSPENQLKDAQVQGFMRGAAAARGQVIAAQQEAQAALARAAAAERAAQEAQQAAAQERAARAAAQAQAQQVQSIYNSQQVQGVLGALREAKGNIQEAATIRAAQEIEAEKARLRASGVVHKIDAGLYLGSGPRIFGFGPGAVTDFGAGLTFVQSNWRGWFKVGGRWSYGGFSAPDGIDFCKPDSKPQPSDRCVRPDEKGNIDWGAPNISWTVAAGAEYNLFARLRFRLGLQVLGDNYAYTPKDSASTVTENTFGFGLLASAQATNFGPFPIGFKIEANRATYITRYGDRHDGVNGFLTFVVDADFLNNLMSVQPAQPAQ